MLQLTYKERNIGGFQKALYWANMPIKPKNHLDFLGRLLLGTVYKYSDYPFFVYTGDRHIDFSLFYNNKKFLKKISKFNQLRIFLYEPLSYYIEDKIYTNAYYSELHSDYKGEIGAEELDSISEFQKRIGLNIIVNTCDYNIQSMFDQKYKNLELVCNDIFIKTNNCELKHIFTGKERIIKKFWCGNIRYTPHRHLVSAYLQDKSCNSSWHFHADINLIKQKVTWAEDNLPWDYLTAANKRLNKDLPVIDVDRKHIKIIKNKLTENIPQQSLDSPPFTNSWIECFCAIVNETRFAQPTGNVSEKVLFAMSMQTPFVLVAGPKSLEYIKKLGFKTFDFLWDESYDLEYNHSKRLKKIFAIIDQINSYSLDDLNKIYFSKKVQRILKHNKKHVSVFAMEEIIL